MKELRYYQSIDGKIFHTKKECEEHEKKAVEIIDIETALSTIAKTCGKRKKCKSCPLYDKQLESCLLKTETNPFMLLRTYTKLHEEKKGE